MGKYVCTHQLRHPSHRFILCKKLMGEVKQIQDTQDALKAYCPYQKHCSCSSRSENTEEARECKYLNQSLKEV